MADNGDLVLYLLNMLMNFKIIILFLSKNLTHDIGQRSEI